MKTYVVHWKQLPERRTHIIENFPDLDLEFIDKYDNDDLREYKLIKKYLLKQYL